MLWPAVCSAIWLASRARAPTLSRLMVQLSVSGHGAQRALDGTTKLAGVGRVGGVTGFLQFGGIGHGRAGLCRGLGLFVARAFRDQAGVVPEGVFVGVVSTELGHHFARYAVHILGGGDFGHLARPAFAGLDAEQVERVRSVCVLDLALA